MSESPTNYRFSQPIVGMIWAQTKTGVIGANGGMPWRLPEDMAHFKRVTTGHPVVMGRRTSGVVSGEVPSAAGAHQHRGDPASRVGFNA